MPVPTLRATIKTKTARLIQPHLRGVNSEPAFFLGAYGCVMKPPSGWLIAGQTGLAAKFSTITTLYSVFTTSCGIAMLAKGYRARMAGVESGVGSGVGGGPSGACTTRDDGGDSDMTTTETSRPVKPPCTMIVPAFTGTFVAEAAG